MIEEHKLAALMEAARWAPSCFNEQPWRFVICNRQRNHVAWQFAISCLAPKNQLWAKDAPLLMLACASESFSRNGKPNRWAQYDTGAASENICLQATSMGLFAHQMGGFDADRAREVFRIPRDITPMALIAVGYYGDTEKLEADFAESEQAPRERKPLQDNFFNGDFETPCT
jgi:nitroreductase